MPTRKYTIKSGQQKIIINRDQLFNKPKTNGDDVVRYYVKSIEIKGTNDIFIKQDCMDISQWDYSESG